MPLSEREQRILEQLERELASEDPKLATTMSEGPKGSIGRYVFAIVGVALGVLLLIIGVSQSLAIVGILGFAVMVGAVVFASTPPKSNRLHVVGDAGVSPSGKPKKSSKKASFTERMEQRWEKRNNGE